MKRYISLQNEWRNKWVNERTEDNDWMKNEDMRDKKKGRILFQRNKSIMQLNTCKEQLNEKKHPSNEKKHPLFADIESSAQFSTSEMFSKYEAALSQLLDTFVPVCSKKGQGTSYYCRWITYETFNFDWIRVTVCPPLGSTRVAEPFDDRLGALRKFSGEHAVRRIGHRGSALPGRCILHIAQENGSTGRRLFSTSRRSRKDSGPPSTVSLVVGEVDEHLWTYRFLRRYSWSALQPRYCRSGVLLRTSLSPTFSTMEHRLSVLQEISSTELRWLILSTLP